MLHIISSFYGECWNCASQHNCIYLWKVHVSTLWMFYLLYEPKCPRSEQNVLLERLPLHLVKYRPSSIATFGLCANYSKKDVQETTALQHNVYLHWNWAYTLLFVLDYSDKCEFLILIFSFYCGCNLAATSWGKHYIKKHPLRTIHKPKHCFC